MHTHVHDAERQASVESAWYKRQLRDQLHYLWWLASSLLDGILNVLHCCSLHSKTTQNSISRRQLLQNRYTADASTS